MGFGSDADSSLVGSKSEALFSQRAKAVEGSLSG
jgi:hypothetical protein